LLSKAPKIKEQIPYMPLGNMTHPLCAIENQLIPSVPSVIISDPLYAIGRIFHPLCAIEKYNTSLMCH
jgi:hypothetical protein